MQIYSRESLDLEGEIVDFRISVNVIHNWIKFVALWCFSIILCKMFNKFNLIVSIWDFFFLSADSFVFITNNLDTGLTISAKKSKASR